MRKYIDLILGTICIGYFIVLNSLSSSKVAFSNAILAIGIILVIFHILNSKFANNKIFIALKKIAKVFICIGLVAFIALEALIISYPKKNKDNCDYIVVLGAGLNAGGQLSLTLKDRLDATLECVNDYKNDSVIVVSGGKGDDEEISEAEAMERYLIENGIPKDKIIKEDKSRNTYENFKFSKQKIEEYSNKSVDESSVKFITTDFHAFRSNMLSKRNGYKDTKAYTTNTVSYLIPVYYSREALAVVKSFIFDK